MLSNKLMILDKEITALRKLGNALPKSAYWQRLALADSIRFMRTKRRVCMRLGTMRGMIQQVA